MKKIFVFTVLFLSTGVTLLAQAPQLFNYQGIARSTAGISLVSQPIGVQVIIHDGSPVGTVVYQETQTVTTNSFGLYNLAVGNGTVVSGTFSGIAWGAGNKYMQVQLDPTGGSAYVDAGTSQLLSVPYAVYSNTANNAATAASATTLTGTVPMGGDVSGTNAAANVVKLQGNDISTTAPTAGQLLQWNSGAGAWAPTTIAVPTVSGTTNYIPKFTSATALGNSQIFDNGIRVGIGTITPLARLHVADSNVVFAAAFGLPTTPGNPPVSGSGRRMMWYPDKAAFRVGSISGTGWDKDSIGNYSFATGSNCKATGFYAAAFGIATKASGPSSIAAGAFTIASGDQSTAIGYGSIASYYESFATGEYATASGVASAAIGNNATASGDYTTAIGSYVSTNGLVGSSIIGDESTATVTNSSTFNQMTMRFANGYMLYTNSAATVGTQVVAGGNSWSTISDRRRKENFAAVNGEDFLKKIARFELTSWNYKTQDPALFRHYGPMAQDFYAAFGKDRYGVIGNDTTIAQADMEGVSFIAIQALEKRTEQLQKENEQLRAEVSSLKNDLDTRMANLEAAISKQVIDGKVAKE
jgi:hypothetical protein